MKFSFHRPLTHGLNWRRYPAIAWVLSILWLILIATRKSLKLTGLKPNQYKEISQAGNYQLVRGSRTQP